EYPTGGTGDEEWSDLRSQIAARFRQGETWPQRPRRRRLVERKCPIQIAAVKPNPSSVAHLVTHDAAIDAPSVRTVAEIALARIATSESRALVSAATSESQVGSVGS